MRRAAGILAAALLAGGCGGVGSDDPSGPEPAESLEGALERIGRAVDMGRCGNLKEIFGDGGSHDACVRRLSRMPTLATAEAKQFGTGGVAWFPGEEDMLVLTMDSERRFRVRAIVGDSTGLPSEASDDIARKAVEALNRDDYCAPLAAISIGHRGKPREWCAGFRALHGALRREAREAEPERLGGDRGIAFYALELEGGSYFTLYLFVDEGYAPRFAGAAAAG